jgi:membrane protein YqaA with SNARE-associated domain
VTDGPAAVAPRLGPPTATQRNVVFGVLGATVVLGWIGDALWASLVDRNPLLLIVLNAKPRYLVLTVNQLDPWVYYPVATLRLLGTKPLVWLIGAWYGHRAVEWAEARSRRGAGILRWVERHFGRFGWVIIAITSNNAVCLLAGAAGFSLVWFMVLAVTGTVVRLWLIAVVGDVLGDVIADLIEIVVANRPAVVALSVAVVLGGLWWQHRRGRSTLDGLADLEHTMDAGERPAKRPEDGNEGNGDPGTNAPGPEDRG